MKTIHRHILCLTLVLLGALPTVAAREFTIESFRALPNDVTAFVEPVRDLNDEACALVKIEAAPEFEFTTPLGIVKRENRTGEIWLYIPKGTKMITEKHPRWGVLRDWPFPAKIESHMAYEMRIAGPEQLVVNIVETRIDTLVVTHTDTLLVAPPKRQPVPLRLIAAATAAYGGKAKTLSGGLFLGAMKRHGGFVHVSTDFRSPGKTAGDVADGPFFTGRTRHSLLIANAGAIHRLSATVAIFEGVGYGRDLTSWQTGASSGNAYLKNKALSHSGVSFEVGAVVTVRRVAITASVTSIRGSQWYGSIGIGYSFGKRKR